MSARLTPSASRPGQNGPRGTHRLLATTALAVMFGSGLALAQQTGSTTATSTVTVRASGTPLQGVWPSVDLRVNGVKVQGFSVDSRTARDYSFSVPAIPAGARVDVVFTNDRHIPRVEDRNLLVDSVTIDGQTIAPNATGVTLDRGAGTRAFDGIDVISGQRGVYWNGALRFTAPQVAVVTPPPPPVVAPVVKQIGQWKELVADVNGKIIASEYKRVAANYNAPEIVDYRLGPKAADFGNATNTAPTLWGPDQTSNFGLWHYGTLPATNPGEREKCVESARLPRSDQEARTRGMEGPAWLVGGAFAYLPDNPGDPDFRYGVGNVKGADGTGFEPSGGTCLRMYAQWYGDFWVRGQIGAPTSPLVRDFVNGGRADLPPVPVAIARGRANASQVGFAAFKDGTIIPTLVGNSAAEFIDISGVRLPAGMVPTAMAVTPYNEFLVVSVWDTNTVSGKLAFIALRPRQMAVGAPWQSPNTRWYWGLPGAWTIRGMKLIGMIDLPFAAPSSLDVSNNVLLGNPRGISSNDNPANGDLSLQSARDRWTNVNPVIDTSQPDIEWSQMAVGGYAIVASRAENKVSFVDMTPLYQFYRQMYLTTQANYDRTVDASTTDGSKWPFSFAVAPAQSPKVVTTLNVEQPTSVNAGTQAKSVYGLDRGTWFGEFEGWSRKEDWSGAEPQRVLGRSRAFVASMDGTVQALNVQGLNFPTSPVGKTVSATPVTTFKAGRNPTFAFTNGTSTASDDLFLVSRGDRSVTFAFPDGRIQSVLRDNRLVDPVAGAVSFNAAGHERTDDAQAAHVPFITIADHNGKALLTYAVEPRRGALRRLYPFRAPSGPVDFLFGSSRPFPGKPFMIDLEEII